MSGIYNTMTTGNLGKLGDPGNIFGGNPDSKFAKPTMPTPPDYKSLIDEQAKQNRINQTTPWGNLTFTTDPKTGQVSANYAQDPQEAALSQQLLGNAGNILDQGSFKPHNYGAQIKSDEQKQFQDAMALMAPQLKQQQDALTQNMADRGLPIGSEIQTNAQNQFDTSRNNLEMQAAMQALGMGQNEQQQLFGEQLQGYNANQATLGSLFNMSKNMPGLNDFFSPSGIDTMGAAGLAQNAAQQNYASQMQQYGSNMGGLASLGGSLISKYSDRRLKENVKRIGYTDSGLPIYYFTYKVSNNPDIGVMADEAKKIFPDAVITGIDGYDRVDYSRIH